jgi:pyrimidine-nucleoside phosphorylase
MFPQHLIAKKRDGRALTRKEIAAFVQGATNGAWADYQLSAMLMAIVCRGMTAAETVYYTEAMMHSGVVADLSEIALPKADKHSTGGVGDKVSLHLAPMVAACGVAVPMISGRGLGHTGGTLDKLEAIPGFRVNLSLDEYRAQIARIGIALIGPTAELAPADRKLYALRDVTATVESIPLICGSIVSKKLAEGIDTLVFDVKFGRGAFMKSKAQARSLARSLVKVSGALGKRSRAVLTEMEEPLGRAVGNALEVKESIACLRGEGPADTMEVTCAIAQEMLVLARVAKNPREARATLERAVASGAALKKFRELVAAQGGDVRVVDDPTLLPRVPLVKEVKAKRSGFVCDVEAMEVALACLRLGAGRGRAEDSIDPAVGVADLLKIGERVEAGAPLCRIHARDAESLSEASVILGKAIVVGRDRPARSKLVAEIVR